MGKSENLTLTIKVNNDPVYFGAPVFYSRKVVGGDEILIIQTEIGNQAKQRIEIQLKNNTYVEPITKVPGSDELAKDNENPSDNDIRNASRNNS